MATSDVIHDHDSHEKPPLGITLIVAPGSVPRARGANEPFPPTQGITGELILTIPTFRTDLP